MSWEVVEADCVEAMAAMGEASVDAICTDPPYGLEFMGKDWDRLQGYNADTGFKDFTLPRQRRRNVKCPDCERYIYDHPGRRCECGGVRRFQARSMQEWHEAWARQAFRVLRPGGHLLAFGGTRTSHRLACAVEDAGFEIRDTVCWLYGSGFPKSLDVGKAIDRQNGRRFEDRYELGRHIRERRMAAGLGHADVNGWFGYRDGCQHWERQDPSGARVPTLADWRVLRERLGLSDEFLPLIERAEAEREKVGTRTVSRMLDDDGYAVGPAVRSGTIPVTAPATPDAARWDGWGTALKPAHEPVVVARKPLCGTVAQNVLATGCGALNIDATRVGPAPEYDHKYPNGAGGTRRHDVGLEPGGRTDPVDSPAGRWPSNVALDEHVAEGMGDVARYFYCAKSSRSERNAGLEGFEERPVTEDDKWAANDRRSGTARNPTEWQNRTRNHHPTVKPIALMRWLVRLVCPPGGTICDPFAGSGSTGCAAVLEGFNFVGIEREAEYVDIARARLAYWADPRAHEQRVAEAERLQEAAEAEAEGRPVQLGFDLGDPPAAPKVNREGEASAERRYTDRGGSNFAMKPGRRRVA